MLKINPLIDLFFTDQPWEKRAELIAACGYRYVETWRGSDPAELKSMNGNGVELISIVMNFATQADIAPINPKNQKAFLEHIDRMADNALAAGCTQGIVTAGQQVPSMSYQAQRKSLVEALSEAGNLVADRGFKLNLEPLNTEVDHAGYMLWSPGDAVAVAKETGCANVKILYDIYHMTIMAGNQTAFLRENMDWIGHFHVAGVPGRHEPHEGETNYPFLLREIEKCGYQGYIGLEYMPLLPSRESLRITAEYFGL
mgnify:CR=1 FL=1|jgi:hydroxypyruvate isomerase